MSDNSNNQDNSYLSKETCDAIAGDRHESIKLWEQVAAGDLNQEVKCWMKDVATAVLDAESKPAGRIRDGAIVRAVGLAGNIDKHRALRDFVGVLHGFGVNRQQIIHSARTGKPPNASIIAFVDYDPKPYADVDEEDLGKIIDRELIKFNKEIFNPET